MPPKSLTDIDPKLQSITEEFNAISVVKGQMAQDAYDVQDAKTKATIDRIVATLQASATGTVQLKVGRMMNPVKLSNEILGFNLLYLAVEIVKDLAFVGIKVANFKFDPKHCADCGSEL